jgi:hypothetical protein
MMAMAIHDMRVNRQKRPIIRGLNDGVTGTFGFFQAVIVSVL